MEIPPLEHRKSCICQGCRPDGKRVVYYPETPLWYETVKTTWAKQEDQSKSWRIWEVELFAKIWLELRKTGLTPGAIQDQIRQTYGFSRQAYYTRYRKANQIMMLK